MFFHVAKRATLYGFVGNVRHRQDADRELS
jgi:hypothetical protein